MEMAKRHLSQGHKPHFWFSESQRRGPRGFQLPPCTIDSDQGGYLPPDRMLIHGMADHS